MKTVGLLTSGGDAPGMNACIRAVVRSSIYNGLRIVGIKNGYDGLINGDVHEMNVSSVADIIQRGGTILGTARSKEFMTEEGKQKALEVLKENEIDSLIVLGGDGTFRGAKALSDMGINTIGIPCTIDNDMGFTDFTIGFFTAVETVMDAISKIRDTSSSHGRGNIIEVMGRSCGDLALYAGLCGGAESIIVPEIDFSLKDITEKVLMGKRRGKLHHIIMLAEGVGNAYELSKDIEEKTGITTKVTVLGHIQRGGTPSSFDRLIACQMGNRAVKLLMEGKTARALGTRGTEIFDMDLIEAVQTKADFKKNLYEIARELSI